MAFFKSKVDRNLSRKKSPPKIEAFDSLDKPFINSNNFDGGLLRMKNHA